ncbi:MAG: hypothetical protein QXW06_07785 [Thermoplasmata archaeon]
MTTLFPFVPELSGDVNMLRFAAISAAFIIGVIGAMGWFLVRLNVSGIFFNERRLMLCTGLLKKRYLQLDLLKVGYIDGSQFGEPTLIHSSEGKTYRAFLPNRVERALPVLFGYIRKDAGTILKSPHQ